MNHELQMKQHIFYRLFALQNRLHTIADRVLKDMTIRQWLLVATISGAPQTLNLSELGRAMGCSRQNIKKLAQPLVKLGYLIEETGDNNQVMYTLGEHPEIQHADTTNDKYAVLEGLFLSFNRNDLEQMMVLQAKLEEGIVRLEGEGQAHEAK